MKNKQVQDSSNENTDSQTSENSDDSHDAKIKEKFDEINLASNQLKLLKNDRHKLQERNDQLRRMLEPYKVIVFPSKTLTAWNGIPRFTFIEANIRDMEN